MVGIDRVLQPDRKYQKRSVHHFYNDLIGVLGGQFRYRWPDDPGLVSRIVKIDGIRPRVRPGIVNTAQEVVWVTVNSVRAAWCADVDPAGGNLEPVVSNLRVIQHVRRNLVDAGNQFLKRVQSMQGLVGLPSLSGLEFGQGPSHVGEKIEDILVYTLRV